MREQHDKWKEAVIEECIVRHLSWDENDPRKTLRALINYEVQLALDPRVSKEAQDLIDQYTDGHLNWNKAKHSTRPFTQKRLIDQWASRLIQRRKTKEE